MCSSDLTVANVVFMGVHYEITLQGQEDMQWLVHTTDLVNIGAEVSLSLEPDAIHVMKTSDVPLAGEDDEEMEGEEQ